MAHCFAQISSLKTEVERWKARAKELETLVGLNIGKATLQQPKLPPNVPHAFLASVSMFAASKAPTMFCLPPLSPKVPIARNGVAIVIWGHCRTARFWACGVIPVLI